MKRLLFGSLALLLFSCNSNNKNETPKAKPVAYLDNKLVVEAVHPEIRTFNTNVPMTGILEPLKKQSLRTLERGIIEKITKNIGDSVFMGDTIAILKNPELWQKYREVEFQLVEAKSNVELFKTQLENAEKDGNFKLKRFDRLSRDYGKKGGISQSDLDLAETEKLTAVAFYNELVIKNEHAEMLVESLQKLKNAWANRTSQLFIVAPFSGIVSKKLVEKGELINEENSAIFEIADNSKMNLIIEFNESQKGNLKIDSPLEIDFLEVEKSKMVEKIARIKNSKKTGKIRAEVEIDNKKGDLKTGMFAKVKAKSGEQKEVIAIPQKAIQTIDNEHFIFLFNNGKAKRMSIQIGLKNEGFIEILNDNLSLDSFVIYEDNGILKEEMEVVLRQ